MKKDELIAKIKNDRALLEDVVARLTDGQLATPGRDGGWSMKDHLSHIAAWERMIVAHLSDGSDAAVAAMDETTYAAATLDELNDRLYRLHRGDTTDDVRNEFAAAHSAIVAYIEGVSKERLSTKYWEDDPSGRTVLEKISGDTYLHYAEHAGWIGELLVHTAEAR